MVFGDLTIDDLIDTGAIFNAMSESDLEQIKRIAPQKTLKDSPLPDFQIVVANGQKETPIA